MSESPPTDELVGRPRFVIEIASGKTVADAARPADISRSHGFTLTQDDAICREIRDIRSRSLLAVASRLVAACEQAVDTLIEVMDDHDAPAYARVNAASAVLSSASSWVQLDSLSEMVEELQAETAAADSSDGLRRQLRAVVGGVDDDGS